MATSLVDLMRRVGAPLGSGPRRYLRDRLAHYGIDTSHFANEPLPERPPRAYPRELLEEAAAASSSIRDMLIYMGVSPDDGPYSHIRKRLDQFGIDTSHFTSGRRYAPGIPPRDELVSAVTASVSLAGVLRTLGIVDTGSGRALVQRGLEAHGISTDHFRGQSHLRGTRSPYRRPSADILRKLPPGSSRTKTFLLRRALDDLDAPHHCSACGIGDIWQGKRLVLEIDHINGDRRDNRIENLRYLCPSCHSQTRSFSKPSHRTVTSRRAVK
ncbi:HNH endonuclease signature motif containing protein [Streptomyces sp. NPDC051018]|uniref:HNH endonuclease signature motif containing protein n=1 Tax=Streptomyces sp. NPDC051018 TaxID=3365639 RepID=UPI0037AA417A